MVVEEIGLEWQIALKELKWTKKYFWLKRRAEKGRSQIGIQGIQRYASFLAQSEGLLVSEVDTYCNYNITKLFKK